MDSVDLVTVPSGDWVTVFSSVLRVPSLLTVLVFSLETSRSHPTSSAAVVRVRTTKQDANVRFIIWSMWRTDSASDMGSYPTSAGSAFFGYEYRFVKFANAVLTP